MSRQRMVSPSTIVIVSDTHCGCRVGMAPRKLFRLDGGGFYEPSELQTKMNDHWDEFWHGWVPDVTRGEPFILVHNGDVIDGAHHGTKTQVSQNHADQHKMALAVMSPIVKRAHTYYHIRGTEAHVGQSAENEELIAQALGAKPDAQGHASRWEMRLDLMGHLCHFTHHISGGGSSSYESTAVYKEMVEAFVDAGRWGRKPPQVVVRSHRHRALEVRIPTAAGHGISAVTAGWQLKTPFAHKLAGARATQPQIGGMMIRVGDRQLFSDSRVWEIDQTETEVFA